MVASAGTVIVGLGMLYFSTFAKVKYTGPTIAIGLAVALLAALTLAPAMLAILRSTIFWPFHSLFSRKLWLANMSAIQALISGLKK